jgi:Arc/MetJ-type ribon-helix-helix transcriptional regulator
MMASNRPVCPQITISVPRDMELLMRGAVASGDYASLGEVAREALRAWKQARTPPRKPDTQN